MTNRVLKQQPVKLLATLCGIMIAVHVINVVFGGILYRFALVPRDIGTLPYIVLAPWLHGSWEHLLNNLLGFCIFSSLCLLRGVPIYIKSSAIIIVLTGLLVWLFGRQAAHIGASGWVFGLWGMSIAIAWFERSFVNIAIAIFVIFFYGGMVWGVLPSDPRVSFESHLFGGISGIVAASVFARKRAARK